MDVGTESSSESSQNIVDELFKDFISKKISKSKSATSTKAKEATKPAKVDEISKLLDLEISSIQAQTKDSSDVVKDDRNQNSSKSVSSSVSQALSTELKNANDLQQNVPASIPLPPLPPQESVNSISKIDDSAKWDPPTKTDVSASVSSANAANLTTASLPTVAKPLAGILPKKLNIPKQLGCKLSTESLSLIQSNDKIDRNGRTWEEGEVESSNSEESNKDSDSDDNDGYPSETGSIHSDKEEWKSSQSSSSKHKKKHKHKHKKKKKKKSSKEKDKTSHESEDEKGSKKSKDKERRSKKDKEESSSNQKDKTSADKERKPDADNERNPDEKVQENGDAKSEKSRDEKSENSRDEKSEKSRDEKSEKSRRRESESETSKKDKKVSDKDKDKNDDKKREKEKKRKHDRSRSRTPKRPKRSRSRSPRKSRRSPSPRRSRYSEWDARRYSDDPKKVSRSRSRSRSATRSKRRRSSDKKRDRSAEKKRDRSSDRKRERSAERKQDKSSKERDKDRDLRLQIDKAKLRKIAIANALNSMKSGQPVPVQIDVAAVKSGGKSVEELTDFCKRISEKEQEKMDNAVSDSSEEEPAPPSDDEEPLIHHPFKVKEANIVMNIRNAKQLPVLTPSEKQAQQATLRLAFPVSSGTHHRASESEWVPVEKTTVQAITTPTTTTSKSVEPKATTESQPPAKDSIFPTAPASVDIGAIISERLQAVRKLQANPYDVQALSSMHKAQQKASQWAQSKHLPGQFVGSTGAQVMSQQELMGDKRRQAWVKKTQFSTATPVSGGIGMFLLQKMGWKQGEGLGKNNEGNTQPLQLDIKIDRKGLQSAADNPKSRPHIPHVPQAKDLSHKHPVSALMELCNKRRWGPPNFTVVQEDGPAHKKCFLFKVKVNNVEYQPAVPSSNKKSAKAQCAAVCLQEMGLLPRDAHVNY